MSLAAGERYRLPNLTPQLRKERTLEALLAQLPRLAARQPVLMLFEDAHVGRDEELALLQRRWQQAKAGEGRVVVLIGEPGIGKSRLAQGMLESAPDNGRRSFGARRNDHGVRGSELGLASHVGRCFRAPARTVLCNPGAPPVAALAGEIPH